MNVSLFVFPVKWEQSELIFKNRTYRKKAFKNQNYLHIKPPVWVRGTAGTLLLDHQRVISALVPATWYEEAAHLHQPLISWLYPFGGGTKKKRKERKENNAMAIGSIRDHSCIDVRNKRALTYIFFKLKPVNIL